MNENALCHRSDKEGREISSLDEEIGKKAQRLGSRWSCRGSLEPMRKVRTSESHKSWNHFGIINVVVMNDIISKDKKGHRSRMKT